MVKLYDESKEQIEAEVIGTAWKRGRMVAILKEPYCNKYIARPLRLAYAAGYISGVGATRRVIVSTRAQAI